MLFFFRFASCTICVVGCQSGAVWAQQEHTLALPFLGGGAFEVGKKWLGQTWSNKFVPIFFDGLGHDSNFFSEIWEIFHFLAMPFTKLV